MEKGKGWIQTALLTAVGIMSGLVGSSWQQYLTVKLEQAKSFDSWRREAYVSYLSGMEKRRISQDNEKASRALKANTPEQRRLKAKADQLKDEWEYEVATGAKKIGVFGNTKVVVALANHWRQHFEESRCGSNWETDLAIFRAMREQALPNEPKVGDADLAQVTMLCDPPKSLGGQPLTQRDR